MRETIRGRIERDLEMLAVSGVSSAGDFALEAVARKYGVSLTPVRQAIGALVRSGVLAKDSSGRAAPVSGRARKGSRRASARPAALFRPVRAGDAIEPALAERIIRLGLSGSTQFLREEETARSFGVGRTVIREVLGRLAGRGFVAHVPRRGWRVRPFVAADLNAYLDVREQLELKALELAGPRLDKAELERMLRANRPPKIDNRLHRYLVDKCDNPYIRDFFDRYGAYYTALFDYATPRTAHVEAMAGQHRAILAALLAGDMRRARRSLIEHIRAQRPIVRELIEQLNTTRHDANDHPGAA